MHLCHSGLRRQHHYLSYPTLPPNRTPSSHPVHHPFAELITPVLHLHSHLNHYIKNTPWPLLTSSIHPLQTTSPPHIAHLQANGRHSLLWRTHDQHTQSLPTQPKRHQKDTIGTLQQQVHTLHTGCCTVTGGTLQSHTRKATHGSPPSWISTEHTEHYTGTRLRAKRKLTHHPLSLPRHPHLLPPGQKR